MPAEPTIRPAAPAERRALEALQRRASLAWEEHRGQLLAHPEAIDLPLGHLTDGRTRVAERDGAVVGFCVVLPRGDGDAELDGLFVEPPAWRSGIGAHLVLEAERIAIRDGAPFLWVVAGPHVEDFYRRCGFARIGEEKTQFGRAVTMRKALPAGTAVTGSRG